MKWNNLLKNRCPQCSADLADKDFNPDTCIMSCDCGFKISEKRYRSLSRDLVETKLENYE